LLFLTGILPRKATGRNSLGRVGAELDVETGRKAAHLAAQPPLVIIGTNPMIPHVIVLEPGLVIYNIYMGYWFFGRPTVEDLRQDLRAVTKKCRPDWDITTPELRAAWQGRKELFYPYGKTYAQTLGEQD
jgi:hypothetical protein